MNPTAGAFPPLLSLREGGYETPWRAHSPPLRSRGKAHLTGPYTMAAPAPAPSQGQGQWSLTPGKVWSPSPGGPGVWGSPQPWNVWVCEEVGGRV